MTDPKKNPNKQRRSFFWRRKLLLLPEPSKPMNGFDDAQREARPWYRPTLLKAAVVGLGVLAIPTTVFIGDGLLIGAGMKMHGVD